VTFSQQVHGKKKDDSYGMSGIVSEQSAVSRAISSMPFWLGRPS
jgi:hypothetical protein